LADGDISYIVDRPLGWLFIILILATLALPMVRSILYRQTS